MSALAELYETDQTAWLEENAKLLRRNRLKDVDFDNLAPYLLEWARQDRLDVKRRLVAVLTTMLKWDHRPQWRTRKRAGRLLEQKFEIESWTDTPTLEAYAKEIWETAYQEAAKRAKVHLGTRVPRFPRKCPYSFAEVLDHDRIPGLEALKT